MMTAELVTYRIYGQPKIHKPVALKGVKPAFSLRLNKSPRKNQIYIVAQDVYVYFFDLFSRPHAFPEPVDMSLPASALQRKYPELFRHNSRKKFVYDDCWATFIDRNEGYVRFPGLVGHIQTADYLPQLNFHLLLVFCELSRQDAGFSPIGMDCMDMQFADYDRLLNNMTGKIHRMIIEKQL